MGPDPLEFFVVQLGGQALASIPAIKGGCFFPGTPVATELGHKRIEVVLPGDRVWACDLTTSGWELRSVVETYVTEYVGETIRVMVAGEWIESTRHHPFWVAEGKNLADRPTPEHVAAAMAEGGTLPGRWVDAGDLLVGDLLLLKDGREVLIEAIEVHLVAVKVYNFQVEGLHNYAVGLGSVLVHNNCAPSNPGRSGKQSRLRELASDPNVSSADRGWIQQELNSIARGQRSTIRVPPGKNLAHQRGYSAKDGYSYLYSDLQDIDLHKLQH